MGKIRRAISVIKKRTGFHEATIREFKISHSGLTMGEPLEHFHGVLSGVPNFTGHQQTLMGSKPT
jgi:circadian clock protein KaiC